MTAASSPSRGGGEVCRERSPNSEDGYCPCISPAGHLDPHRCLHGSRWIRPTTEPPAETQQDDEEGAARAIAAVWASEGGAPLVASEIEMVRHMARAALAARPSADAETLLGGAVQALARVEAEVANWPAADFWHRDAIRAAIQGEQR